MSLYYVQKLLYQLNRDANVRSRFESDRDGVIGEYRLNADELQAIQQPDIGLLYVMGVNGQLLMHYAAMAGYEWDEYQAAMREGEKKYGAVRDGLYVRAEGAT